MAKTQAGEPSNEPLAVAVIGAGRMGRHHARTYQSIERARLVGVVDLDSERAKAVTDEFEGRPFSSSQALLEAHPELGAVSIASPTQRHREAASPFLERQIACLIEKPLGPTTDQARAIKKLAEQHGTVLQVGHTERFNPAVRAMTQLDLTARFIEVDRISPMTFRSLDIGVVMDMMIHDLDIVLMLADSPLKQIDASGVAVIGEHEDIANARLVFDSGCVANLTASRLALKTQRGLRLFSESGYVSLDYANRSAWAVTAADNLPALQRVRGQLAQGKDLSQTSYADLLNVRELDMQTGSTEQDPLTAELSSFLDAARTGNRPTVTADAGLAAVDAAERVVQAIDHHTWEQLPKSPFG